MVNMCSSAFWAAAIAALIIFLARLNANRQHVRKLQAANAVRSPSKAGLRQELGPQVESY